MSAECAEEYTCNICGESFGSEHGVSIHESTAHSKPWHDEDTLRELYVDKEISSEKMAEMWDCDPKTVRNNLDRYGIERRSPGFYQRNNYASYRVSEAGYCDWWDTTNHGGNRIAVHRLLAVAEYGVEAVMGMHVHHINGVKWDNRPDNIELKDPSEHAREHYENGDLELQHGGIEEMSKQLEEKYQ